MMNLIDGTVLLQTLHGMVGALAVASCLHPVLTVRKDKVAGPRIRLSAWLATAMTGLTFSLGLYLYGDYRISVKPWLINHAPAFHFVWFETKEALAYLVLCAALTGAPLLQFGYRQAQARALAKMMYFIAFWGGLSAAVSGMIVASVRSLS